MFILGKSDEVAEALKGGRTGSTTKRKISVLNDNYRGGQSNQRRVQSPRCRRSHNQPGALMLRRSSKKGYRNPVSESDLKKENESKRQRGVVRSSGESGRGTRGKGRSEQNS